MTEQEQQKLLNDLGDYIDDLNRIVFPPKAKEIDLVKRAMTAIDGNRSKWRRCAETKNIYDGEALAYLDGMQCEACGAKNGKSFYAFCPDCGARMK